MLLALVNIGSKTAFDATVSLVISAYYAAFSISAAALLYRRLTTPKEEMYYGPFHLGRAGIPIIIMSIIYSVIGVIFSFWPGDAKPTLETMNWSIVVSGGMFVFCLIFWVAYGRKVYKGPVVEVK